MAARVLHLLSQRPGWTGSGVALDACLRIAKRAGWEQAVVVGTSADDPTPAVGGLDPGQIWPLVFESKALPFTVPGMSDVMPYPSSQFSALSDLRLAAYREAWKEHVARVIHAFEPDVIHSHHFWILSAMVKDLAPDIPVVTHCHGTGLRQWELCPHLAAEVQAGCARNDRFLVLHRGHADVLAQALKATTEKIHVIGSGFRDDIFNARGRVENCGPVITYAGKLSRAKGLPWLIEAVDRMAADIPEVELNIAGSGSGAEADAIREQIDGAQNVVFHGQLDQQGLADLLRRSAVFVLPSFYEGLPLVLVEAAACGCRLVSTELPGVVDQLQSHLGESLELVPLPRLQNTDCPVEQDLPAFVDQLTVALRNSLARRGLEDPSATVAGMTWNAVFGRIEAVWSELLTEYRSGSA